MKRVLLGLMLLGCDATADTTPKVLDTNVIQVAELSGSGGGATLFRVKVGDRTCFVVVGYSKAALSCL